MKTQEEVMLKNRLIVAFDIMMLGDIRDMVEFAEASARENPRNQPVFQLIRGGGVAGVRNSRR